MPVPLRQSQEEPRQRAPFRVAISTLLLTPIFKEVPQDGLSARIMPYAASGADPATGSATVRRRSFFFVTRLSSVTLSAGYPTAVAHTGSETEQAAFPSVVATVADVIVDRVSVKAEHRHA